ncbi:MAG: YlxP-like protein, partial [uncultured Pseudonocardia sp.]
VRGCGGVRSPHGGRPLPEAEAVAGAAGRVRAPAPVRGGRRRGRAHRPAPAGAGRRVLRGRRPRARRRRAAPVRAVRRRPPGVRAPLGPAPDAGAGGL